MATFQAGGLASGLDTNALIDALVSTRGSVVTQLKSRQAAFNAQVSVLGDITSKLNAFKTAAVALAPGARGVVASGTLEGLTISAGTQAQAGRYSVEVSTLARAAKHRSAGQPSATSPVAAGTLTIAADGTSVDIDVGAGATLQSVAAAINAQAPKVSATVLSDGTQTYLSITARETGHTPGQPASSALQLSGSVATALGFTEIQPASNATVIVDGLTFTRRTNAFSDVIPGVTMTLSKEGPRQELVLGNDASGTAKNLQAFVDSYNAVVKAVQKQLQVVPGANRGVTLAGDAGLKALQGAMQQLTARQVGSGQVRSLADLGFKTGRDGTLSIDSTVLDRALSRDPAGVDAVFTTASTGISAAAATLADDYTDGVDGVLTMRSKGISGTVKRLSERITKAEAALAAYRELLVSQYTAMEKVVGGLKSIGNYLDRQEAVQNKS